MGNEIMKWKVEKDHNDWFILEMQEMITFSKFLDDILSRKDNYGTIRIQGDIDGKKMLSMTYSYGAIRWQSDDMLNRMNDYILVAGRAHGFPTHIDYHIMVKENSEPKL